MKNEELKMKSVLVCCHSVKQQRLGCEHEHFSLLTFHCSFVQGVFYDC